MEKSIEAIWKQGFLKEDSWTTGKVVDIYNRKSTHLVDRMHRMFKGNATFLYILLGVHVLMLLLIFQLPVHGIVMGLLFIPLITYGRKQLRLSMEIDKTHDSYHFLRSFNDWLQGAITGYTKIYRWFYPIYFITLGTAVWMAPITQPIWDKLMMKFPGIFWMVDGIPLNWALGLGVLALMSSIFAPKLYEWDLRTVYGSVFDKLDEMVAEMEELRGEVKA